jgi:hypothetical protein
VRRLKPAQNVEDAVALMDDPQFDPAADAIVEGMRASADVSSGSIVSEHIENTRLEWDVETGEHSFLVVADAFFPGWHASIDGRAATIFPVDGCLRGVEIEGAGRHHVIMTFRPWGLYAGSVATLVGVLLLALIWLGQAGALKGAFERMRV